MGIYLPNMEIPRPGEAITIFCSGDAHRFIIGMREALTKSKAIPIPPHGRLIDADALIISLETQDYSCAPDTLDDWTPMDMTKAEIADIEAAPTIILASEEDAKTEEDSEPWLCMSCRHYPPSSTDGKPCSQCDPREVLHSCYDPAEEGE